MTKKLILLTILILVCFININSLNAKSDEETRYALALEERQEYCNEKYNIYMDDAKFIQPLMSLDQKNIKDISNLYCMATFYENNDKLDEAMQNYLDILKLEPNFVDIIIKVAEFYETYKSDNNRAIVYYNKALNIIDAYLNNDISFLGDYTDIYSKIINIYKKMDIKNDVILKYYDDLIKKLDDLLINPVYANYREVISGKKIDFLLEKADYLNSNNNANEAINIYEGIIFNEDSQNIEAIEKLANIYYRLGLLSETKNLLEYAESNISSFHQNNLLLGKVYFELGGNGVVGEDYYGDALSALNKALMEGNYANDDLAEIYYYRGRTYFVLGSCNEAKNDFQQAKLIDEKIFDKLTNGMDWSNIKCN
jgi:tetratricopeptide (TPR) repeat protein